MKKLIVFCSMIVALGFVVAGCGGDSAPAPAAPATDSAPADEDAGGDEDE